MKLSEILEYYETCGAESAYNLVLLLGPDNFEGGLDAYQKLLERFEKEAA